MPKIDFSQLKIPFLGADLIKKRADAFRNKHWDKIIPINIEKIIDVSLAIDIVPVPEMEELCNTNALISSDWSSLYVDKRLFDDERRYNRLRFSYAHEIGHYVLHKQFYASLKIYSIEDFYMFFKEIPNDQYNFLEAQANKFAGYFLAPREILRLEIKKLLDKNKSIIDLKTIDEKMLKSYMANPLAKKFGISQESMEIILNEYDLKILFN